MLCYRRERLSLFSTSYASFLKKCLNSKLEFPIFSLFIVLEAVQRFNSHNRLNKLVSKGRFLKRSNAIIFKTFLKKFKYFNKVFTFHNPANIPTCGTHKKSSFYCIFEICRKWTRIRLHVYFKISLNNERHHVTHKKQRKL